MKEQKKRDAEAATKKDKKDNAHVYAAEDYFEGILRKVENLKGKGKPVSYCIVAARMLITDVTEYSTKYKNISYS